MNSEFAPIFELSRAERLKRIGWLLLGVMLVQFLSSTMVVAILESFTHGQT